MNILRFMKNLGFLSPRQRLEWYPPFWLMRVKVLELADDWSIVRLRLPLTAFSRNMGDSMFGGYQAAVADPVAALACAKRFPGFDVWTRSMSIDFVAVGDTDLELRFEFDLAINAQIRNDLATRGRSNPRFEYAFYRLDGECCSRIINIVAIRPEGYKPRNLSVNSVSHTSSEESTKEL